MLYSIKHKLLTAHKNLKQNLVRFLTIRCCKRGIQHFMPHCINFNGRMYFSTKVKYFIMLTWHIGGHTGTLWYAEVFTIRTIPTLLLVRYKDNGVARTLKKVRTSKGDYWIKKWFSSISSLFKMRTFLKGKNLLPDEANISFMSSSL